MSVVPVTVTKCVVASMSVVTVAVTVNVTKCVVASMSTIDLLQNIWAMREQASMSTLISNLKVNDESLWGYVKPMPPPPALALAHEVWRATRDGDTAAAKDALEKLTALTERRHCPNPDQGIVPSGNRRHRRGKPEHHSTCTALPAQWLAIQSLSKESVS